jgi:hypothetical protein
LLVYTHLDEVPQHQQRSCAAHAACRSYRQLPAKTRCCSLWHQEEGCSAIISGPLHVPNTAWLIFGVHNNLQEFGKPSTGTKK